MVSGERRLTRVNATDLERAFLATHWTAAKVAEALGAGVREDSFSLAAHAAGWDYLVARVGKGDDPSLADLRVLVGVELPTEITDARGVLEELLFRTMAVRARGVLIAHAGGLEVDPVAAVQEMVVGLSSLSHPSTARTSYTDAEPDRLIAAMREKVTAREEGRVIGIPTGWRDLDARGDSWKPGELVGVLGKMNVGKSAVLLRFGATAYLRSRSRVLILSPESTAEDMEARLFPMLAPHYGMRLSNRAIRSGEVDPELFARFVTTLAAEGRRDLIIRDAGDAGVFTLQDIVAQVREHRPNVVIIDGFHLISAGENTWQSMRAAAQTLKGLGQAMGHVTLAGSQVTRAAVQAPDDVPEMGMSAYGLALEETANRIIHLAEVRGDQMRRVYKVSKHRDGERQVERRYLRFDVDAGIIEPIDPQEDEETGEVSF